MISSRDLRRAYLEFFESKGHKVLPSSSLIPQGDPTLLLTSAGMVQIKPFFTGELKPPAPRLASCQKCFRTSDIESVGDATHQTFFEMLGNFSVGDYFKKEAIVWAWEFVTETLAIPADCLWVTYYKEGDQEDLEARGYWIEATKGRLPESRIVPLGAKYNWWGPAGEEGPCGPCSEIHYSYDPEHMTLEDLTGDSVRAMEFWNLVFTQFYHHRDGRRTPLPAPNIDTGMGLERITRVLQGVKSAYETDIFAPLIARAEALTGRRRGESEQVDRSLRIMADHARAVTFLVADGVLPSNEGRGYVLRRVLRRAAAFANVLGRKEPFLAEMARTVIDEMGDVYPELRERREFVLKLLEQEEGRFQETLIVGLDLLEGLVQSAPRSGVVSGADAFRLYDTYGFPIELTREILGERSLKVDEAGFKAQMERQRARARAAHRFGLGERGAEVYQELARTPTKFLGYDATQAASTVVGLVLVDSTSSPRADSTSRDSIRDADGSRHSPRTAQGVERVEAGQEAEVVLAETPFYGESGGQMGDTGELRGPNGRFVVTDAVRPLGGLIVHRGQVAEGSISLEEVVEATVDRERRLDLGRNHTATHLLQSALRQVLGEHVHQTGSLVAPDRLRFDFSHVIALSEKELAAVESKVNEFIRADLPVSVTQTSYREAVERGAIALFDEKYGDVVRLVEVHGPEGRVSAELCGGTHLERTGQIGFFLITAESSIGGGLRRIEAVTGRGAEALVRERFKVLEEVSKTLQAPVVTVSAKAASNVAELKEAWVTVASLERDGALHRAEALLSQVKKVNGISVLSGRVSVSNLETMRQVGDWLRDKLGSGVVVLGDSSGNIMSMVSPDWVEKGLKAGDLVKEIAKVAGGSGGGRPHLGQGKAKDLGKMDEALRQAPEVVGRALAGEAKGGSR